MELKRHTNAIFLRKKRQTSFKLHIFLVIFPFQAQPPICWHLFATCHYLKFYSCIPFALLMVCHYSHVYTCLILKGVRKKKKKEKEIKRASFICQVWYDPTRDNASNSPVYKAQLATSIHIIFFLAVFDIEVLHAELDETWLKHLLWDWQASHQSQNLWKQASHTFLAHLLIHPA